MYSRSQPYSPTEEQQKNRASYTRCRTQGLIKDRELRHGTPRWVRVCDFFYNEKRGVPTTIQEHYLLMRHQNNDKIVNPVELIKAIEHYQKLGYRVYFNPKDSQSQPGIRHGHIIKE